MTTLVNTEPLSVTNEWLQLETATEIIGQMIAYYVALIAREEKQEVPNQSIIEQGEELIRQLGRERKACYRSDTRDLTIHKAFTEYVSFLKGIE